MGRVALVDQYVPACRAHADAALSGADIDLDAGRATGVKGRARCPLFPLSLWKSRTVAHDCVASCPAWSDTNAAYREDCRGIEKRSPFPCGLALGPQPLEDAEVGFCFSDAQRRTVYFPPDFDRSTLLPYRIIVRSVDGPAEAEVSLPAMKAIKVGRPDAHVTGRREGGGISENRPQVDTA